MERIENIKRFGLLSRVVKLIFPSFLSSLENECVALSVVKVRRDRKSPYNRIARACAHILLFVFFAFTSSPACCNVVCYSRLGVKVLPISLHLLGEQLSGLSDGSKKVGEERELGARVGEGDEDAKAFTPTRLPVRRIG